MSRPDKLIMPPKLTKGTNGGIYRERAWPSESALAPPAEQQQPNPTRLETVHGAG